MYAGQLYSTVTEEPALPSMGYKIHIHTFRPSASQPGANLKDKVEEEAVGEEVGSSLH